MVEVDGSGADEVPLDETHLVVRAMRAAFEQMDAVPAGLRLTCTNVIPHARGLGSSSAAIVGGLSLARALVAGGSLLFDDDTLFALAARIEGHPDNVAPACYGGFVISGRDDDGQTVMGSSTPSGRRSTRGSASSYSCRRNRSRPSWRAACCPSTCRMPMRPPTPAARRCSSRRSAASPSTCCAPPGTTSTRTTGATAMPESLALVDALRADGVRGDRLGRRAHGAGLHQRSDQPRHRGPAGPLPGRLDGDASRRRHPSACRSPDCELLTGWSDTLAPRHGHRRSTSSYSGRGASPSFSSCGSHLHTRRPLPVAREAPTPLIRGKDLT